MRTFKEDLKGGEEYEETHNLLSSFYFPQSSSRPHLPLEHASSPSRVLGQSKHPKARLESPGDGGLDLLKQREPEPQQREQAEA